MIRSFARPYAQALLNVAGSTEQAVAVRDQLRALRGAHARSSGPGRCNATAMRSPS